MEVIKLHQERLKPFIKEGFEVTPDKVFKKGSLELFKILDEMVSKVLLEGSVFKNIQNLQELLEKAEAGKRCIILPEHYSNFDYPCMQHLMRKAGMTELAERCIAIAGLKLAEENPYISILTDSYDMIYVYPGRSIYAIQDPEKKASEVKRCKAINIASMRLLNEVRDEGRIVVVFPTGTRYRPGKPETKKGMREIDSYIKSSDYMMLVSINGNCLEISQSGDMGQDIVKKDKIILDASPVIDCAEFRKNIIAGVPDGEDRKQAIVDAVMDELETMHIKNEAEQKREGK
ncbi:MAG: glycerol-3-phosphate acyltransferase [Treponema sp.]|nr:MAG: glycerol-3-phosphate acyltransferase [Treponema sp.]